eukprot:1157270-Pelagomonas_calceolata.AAC.11
MSSNPLGPCACAPLLPSGVAPAPSRPSGGLLLGESAPPGPVKIECMIIIIIVIIAIMRAMQYALDCQWLEKGLLSTLGTMMLRGGGRSIGMKAMHKRNVLCQQPRRAGGKRVIGGGLQECRDGDLNVHQQRRYRSGDKIGPNEHHTQPEMMSSTLSSMVSYSPKTWCHLYYRPRPRCGCLGSWIGPACRSVIRATAALLAPHSECIRVSKMDISAHRAIAGSAVWKYASQCVEVLA